MKNTKVVFEVKGQGEVIKINITKIYELLLER